MSLLAQRLAEGARAQHEHEPLSPAHACALLDVEATMALVANDPLDAQRALWDWRWWARQTQLQPADDAWSIWLILAGRGWGKSRTGVEWVRERVQSGDARNIGLIGPSLSDVWKTLVFGTPDAPGLSRVFAPWERRIEVRRQDRQVVMHAPSCKATGVECGCPVATVFTAEEPEVRGPNIDTWLCDELAKWRYLETCWDNIEMTTRVAGRTPPRICITTTPRPLDLIKQLLDDPDVRVTWGSTFANAANVSAKWLSRMLKRFGGSRQGQQELFGQVLGDNPDAMFRQGWLNAGRVIEAPRLKRVCISVDPSISTTATADLTGIMALGSDARDELYPLADLTGGAFDRDAPGLSYWSEKEPKKHTPDEWGELVCRAVEYFGRLYGVEATVVVERNRGGDLVRANVINAWKEAVRRKLVSAPTVKIEEVTATKGKAVRAEPVAALCEQGRVHFVGSAMHEAETEICGWNPRMDNPGKSPGRLDAFVWGAFALLGLADAPAPEAPDMRSIARGNAALAASTPKRAAIPFAGVDRHRKARVC